MQNIINSSPGALIIDGHIQGLSLARSLGEKGIPVIIVDKNLSIAGFSRFVTKSFRSPDYHGEAFIKFLLELAANEKLHGWSIITTDDSITANISSNKKTLSEFYKIIAPDPIILEKIINKKKFLEIGENLGIPVPKIFKEKINNAFDFDLKFPVIIKGDYGRKFYMKHKTKAMVFNDFASLQDGLSRLNSAEENPSFFIQELLPLGKSTRIISFTAFSIDGEIKSYWIGEKVREHPPTLGTATMSKSCMVPELVEMSGALLKELKYTGVSEIEFLKLIDDNKFYLIEMNPRTWLWVSLAKRCGIDYAVMIYNYLNGIQMEYPQQFKDDIYWVNPITDIPYSLKGIISGVYSFKEVFKSYFKVKDFSVFKLSDPFPAFMMIMLLPYIALKR